MFRRATPSEEPRFLKDLLQALRDSEEDFADDWQAADTAAPSDLSLLPPAGLEAGVDAALIDHAEMETIRAEIALLRERSAEWKEAVRLDREQSSFLSDLQLAA